LSAPVVLALMSFCFLFFGYLGVPVPFALLSGVFIGAATATRRNDHLYLTAFAESMHGKRRVAAELVIRLIVLAVAICMVYYGYINYLRGFGSFRLPSNTPIASLYAAIPISGILIALFTVEQIVNGCRNGFDHPDDDTGAIFGRHEPGGRL
jgi:TRAP-type C4-dicarboxylate transport system permease small subunit